MDFEIVKETVKEMIKDGESTLYIQIYLNDLMRSNDITVDEYLQIINM